MTSSSAPSRRPILGSSRVSGIVRIRVTPEFYVNHLAQIARFKRAADGILQVGTFGNPPTLDDVGSLTLDDADLRSLRNCRVGHCGVQLSADAINRLHDSLDWRRADATVRANGLMRQILVDYVGELSEGGRVGLDAIRRSIRALEPEPGIRDPRGGDAGNLAGISNLGRHLLDYPRRDPLARSISSTGRKRRSGGEGSRALRISLFHARRTDRRWTTPSPRNISTARTTSTLRSD